MVKLWIYRNRLYLTAWLCCLLAGTAHANLLEEVVVTAERSPQPLANVTSNIALVSQKELRLIGATHINETLSRIAGAWISRGNGQEMLTALRSPVLTGAGACGAFLMAQDNIPLRASGFCNVNELFDANSEQAATIEVIKGPASVLYGSNAMNGVINVLMPAVTAVHRLSVEVGPHQYYRGMVSLGNSAWRLDANGTSDGGYKDNSGYGQQKLTLRNQTGSQSWKATTTFSATNLNQDTAGYITGHDAYKSSALRRYNPNPEAYRDTQSARLYSRLERHVSGEPLIVITPYLRYARMNFLQHYLPGKPIEYNGQKSIGFQSSVHWPTWIWGIDGDLTQGFVRETQPHPTEGSAFLIATIPQGEHYNYVVNAMNLATFAQGKYGIGDSAELTVGARAEYVRYNYNNRMIAGRTKADGTPCAFGGCRFNRPADRSDTFFNVSPKLGLLYFMSRNAELYINISRGFRAPQTSELYRLQNDQSVSNIDSVNLDSFEVGARGGTDTYSFDVAVYVMRKHNFIFQNTDRSNVDNGVTSHRGIELSVSRQLTGALTARLSWSYAVHKYVNTPALSTSNIDGNDMDTAPRNMGWASLEFHPNNRITAELEWVHMGRYFEDPQNLHVYPGHDLFNLHTRFQLSTALAATVRITNLTNAKYAERADYAFGTDRYFVGEPRSVYVSLIAQL